MVFNVDGTNIITINDDGEDHDFRVESSGNANMLFVDGGNDRVGIGRNDPNRPLSVQKDVTAGSLNTAPIMGLYNATAAQFTTLDFAGANDNAFIGYKDHASSAGDNRKLSIGFGTTESLIVGKSGKVSFAGDIDVDGTANLDAVDIDGALTQDAGNVVFNEDSGDYDFRVESNG